MKPIAIVYGSSSDNTKHAAEKIAAQLSDTEVTLFDVYSAKVEDIAAYSNLILGTSTWGLGDLQDDWEGFVSDFMEMDFEGKTVALFGLGDSAIYSDSFCDGMGVLYQDLKDKPCEIIGFSSTDGYDFVESSSIVDDMFVGLALDEDNEYDQTDERIEKWVNEIKSKLQ